MTTFDVTSDWSRAQRGDTRAFERVYRANVRMVYAFALRRCASIADAEDVTGHCFSELWRQRASVTEQDDRGLLPWLFTVAMRRVAGLNARNAREREALHALAERSESACVGPSSVVDVIEQTIEELDDDTRLIARLAWEHGLTSRQIGDYLKLSPSTVRSRLQSVRRRVERANQAEVDHGSQRP